MQITLDSVVSVSYQLEIKNDKNELEIVDASKEGSPLVFLFGHHNLIYGFERNLEGKSVGDSYDFWVTPEEGYGLSDPQQIVNLPMDTFKDKEGNLMEDLLVVGTVVPMNNAEGHRINGTIKGITSTDVIMDFNHPLANKDLHFTGTVEKIRTATADEIAHGHVHGDGGVHH